MKTPLAPVRGTLELIFTLVLLLIGVCHSNIAETTDANGVYYPCGMDAIQRDADHIVIGGGFSGMATAHYLGHSLLFPKVIVLSSGPGLKQLTRPDLVRDVNGMIELSASDPDGIGKVYKTVPQPNAYYRQLDIPYYEVESGGGAGFAMGIDFPSEEFFDNLNVNGWTLPLFKTYFSYMTSIMKIRKVPQSGYTDVQLKMLETYAKFNYTFNNDPKNGNISGMYPLEFSRTASPNAKRLNTFISLVEASPLFNVRIFSHTLVKAERFAYDQYKNTTVIGVCARNKTSGQVYYYKHKQNSILAGGVGTAQFLMLSGIGDKNVLNALNITVRYHNPYVGTRYWLHPNMKVYLQTNDTEVIKPPLFEYQMGANMYAYGPPERKLNGDAKWFHGFGMVPFPRVDQNGIPVFDANGSIIIDTLGLGETTSTVYKSMGTITINSANINDPPVIDPHLFENNDDFNNMVDATLELRNIDQTQPTKTVYTNEIGTDTVPNYRPAVEPLVRATVGWGHDGGGAPAGNKNDPTRVVDNYMRLIGVKNAYVTGMPIFGIPIGQHTSGIAGTSGLMAGCFARYPNIPQICGLLPNYKKKK